MAPRRGIRMLFLRLRLALVAALTLASASASATTIISTSADFSSWTLADRNGSAASQALAFYWGDQAKDFWNVQPSAVTGGVRIEQFTGSNIDDMIIGLDLNPIAYDPQTQGSIFALDFTLSYQCNNSINGQGGSCAGDGQGIGLALEQDGKFYIVGSPPEADTCPGADGCPGAPPLSFSANGLTLADFNQLTTPSNNQGSSPITLDTSSHPNDTDSIDFGFYTANNDTTHDEGVIYTAYQLTIDPSPVPEPSSFAVLGAGLIALGLAHRRRMNRRTTPA
jgi:hypothetical protein